MLFREKLFELRQQSGMTQKQTAEKAGMSMLTYRNYEQGTRLPGVPGFMKLVKALGVPCEVFAECDDIATPSGKKKTPKEPSNRRVGRPPKRLPATPPSARLPGTEKKPHTRSQKGR